MLLLQSSYKAAYLMLKKKEPEAAIPYIHPIVCYPCPVQRLHSSSPSTSTSTSFYPQHTLDSSFLVVSLYATTAIHTNHQRRLYQTNTSLSLRGRLSSQSEGTEERARAHCREPESLNNHRHGFHWPIFVSEKQPVLPSAFHDDAATYALTLPVRRV